MASGYRCLYVGCLDGIEVKLSKELPCESLLIPGLKRTSLKQKLLLPLNLLFAWLKLRQLWKRKIGALIATGGYVSLMPCWTAKRNHTPIVLLEQNCIPGKVVRYFASTAKFVGWTFPPLKKPENLAKERLIGNPITKRIRDKAIECDHSKGAKRLLIMGGSQSALSLDLLLVRMANQGVLENFTVTHIATGSMKDALTEAYHSNGVKANVMTFCHDMTTVLSNVDIAICRAGASTATELSLFAIPAIFIPYPYAADNHQAANAQYFVDADAGCLIKQEDDSEGQMRMDQAVINVLSKWQIDDEYYQVMAKNMKALSRPDAALQVVAEIDTLMQPGQ